MRIRSTRRSNTVHRVEKHVWEPDFDISYRCVCVQFQCKAVANYFGETHVACQSASERTFDIVIRFAHVKAVAESLRWSPNMADKDKQGVSESEVNAQLGSERKTLGGQNRLLV